MNFKNLKVAIVGSSLGGLSAANVLSRLGFQVEVFEYYPAGFHNRGGALGGVDMQLVREICPNGNAHKRINGHGHFYGDLWQYFFEGLPDGTVKFGIDAQEILSIESDTPQLKIGNEIKAFDLIIGADGGKSTIRQYVTNNTPKYSGYTLWRGLVSAKGIEGPPSGARTINSIRYETLGFPFVGAGGTTLWNCGVYMAMPESEVEKPSRNRQVGKAAMKSIPEWFMPFVELLFDQRSTQFWKDCVKHGKVTPHAVWEFAAEQVVNNRIILLGDAAHMASPRTGAGAYTAMVDSIILGAAFEQGNTIEAALQLYNENTVERGQQLYNNSRRSAAYFAPENRVIISPKELLYRKMNQTEMDF